MRLGPGRALAHRVPVQGWHSRRARGTASRAAYGPAPPGVGDSGVDDDSDDPLWYRQIQEARKEDPELERVLGNAQTQDEVSAKMEEHLQSDPEPTLLQPKLGSTERMRVLFRAYDPAMTYMWLKLYSPPSEKELQILDQVIMAWFTVGRCGGYDATNMQVQDSAEGDMSYSRYFQRGGANPDDDQTRKSMYHDIGEIETKRDNVRFRVDMGTGDELGLDVLINCLNNVSADYVGIKQLSIGGADDDWPVPAEYSPELAVQPIKADPRDMEQTEDEWWEERQMELEGRIDELRRKHPKKYAALQKLQGEFEETPEGQFYRAQDDAIDAQEEEEAAVRGMKAGPEKPGSGGESDAEQRRGYTGRKKGYDVFDL